MAEQDGTPPPARVAMMGLLAIGIMMPVTLPVPILRELGATATLFLTTGFLGGDNGWPGQPDWAPRFPLLDWEQVEALHGAGWRKRGGNVTG